MMSRPARSHGALRLSVLLAAAPVVAALALAGCAPGNGTAAPTESADPSPTETEAAEPTVDPRDVDIAGLTIPAETCGDGEIGWDQPEPIALADGAGEAFDENDEVGAAIMDSGLVGYSDVDGDGQEDIVLWVTCSGTPMASCCAGSGALLDAVVALDVTGEEPERIGTAIFAGGDEPFRIIGTDAELDGAAVVAHEVPVYVGDQDLPERTVRYEFADGEWVGEEV
ncbi:MAG: hypothetical protein ACTHZX_13645 [Microbacterium sp.]